jgi:hypothetical protein
MTSYKVEIDTSINCAMIEVKEDSGDIVDFQIDYSPTSGTLDFHDRWLLERDYGADFIAAMVADVEGRIKVVLKT